jgi:serine/threonine protein kinase/ABC-type branched-subunit amino acid transport system substrate-binding protein
MTTAISQKYCPVCGREYPGGDVCEDDGATLLNNSGVADPLVGQVLKGTYKILECIAQGGMGVIYRASQMPLGRSVAVKVVHANPLATTETVQRFFREARLLSQVNHPNVVNLIDFGNTEGGTIFMVMEHLTGRTLDKAVPRDQGLPIDMVIDLMEQICAGVSAAHRIQMVHRDLKPSNIFLANIAGDGVLVKLLDFGIAKGVDESKEQLTQNGVMIGSSGYMSPEQITGSAEVDLRSDIYALGGVLYFMLAGQPAYRGKNTRSILTKQLAEQPEPIDFDRLGKPEGKPILPVILTAMHPEPDHRYQSAAELMEALRDACGVEQPSTSWRQRRQVFLSEGRPGKNSTIRNAISPTKSRPQTESQPAGQPGTGTGVQQPGTGTGMQPLTGTGEGVALLDPRLKKFIYVACSVGLLLLFYIAGMMILQMNKEQDHTKGGSGQVASETKESPAKSQPRVLSATAPGVTENEILLGMSAAFNGPAAELGRGMKLGIDTYFKHVNDNGGVNGRKLRLLALDDGYEPSRAFPNMKALHDLHKVFAVIGNVGTPTAQVTVPYALEQKMLFFGAFTGAGLLRKVPPDRYVFNYRASYAEETAAMVQYLIEIKKLKPEQIAVFAQNDAYGDAGFVGVAKGLRKYGRDQEKILRVGYERNTVDVDAAVQEILKHKDEIKAIIMVPAYRPAARFIQKLRDAKVDAICASVSFVGSEALAEELKQIGTQYAPGVIVTQVVPHYDSKATAVLKYREQLQKYFPAEQPSFISLEGYLAAQLLVEGLRKAGENLTTDTLIEALESIQNLDMGIGAPIRFGPSEHQGSHKVWGTVLDASVRYQILELD